jgi:hypothetical protein
MRFCYLLFFVLLVGCTQKQPPLSSDKAVIVDTLIQKTPLKTPVARQELNWSNVLALMESLHEIPSDQRAITLKNIKAEAIKLNRQAWPKDWDTKPIRARFNVFVTHVSIAADQRLGDAALEEQSLAINKMKTSWDIFADLISGDIMLSGFNPTISQPIRKTE